MKFLIEAPFDSLSGYGNDGVGLAQALDDAGHDVHLKPTSVTPPIEPQVANLLTKWPHPPFDAAIIHLWPEVLVSHVVRRATPRMVAWTMWEYEHYREKGWEELSRELQGFDLILAYDEVSQKAMADPVLNTTGTPVQMLQGGYRPNLWRETDPRKRDWNGTFRFGMVGRLDRRKNPWGAVRAFGRLKDEHGDAFDAELHLKTTTGGKLPRQIEDRWPGIVVHYEWWDHARLRDFYLSLNCYLAPSTGEGKNVPALEALTTGCPAIATDYGGHKGWLRPELSYPLSWEPYEWPQGPAALPDEGELERLMWHVYTHRGEARERGMVAARTIPSMIGWDAAARRLVDVVSQMPVGGERRGASDRRAPMHGESVPALR